MPQQSALRVDEQKLNDVFNEHLRTEIRPYSPDETIATMIANLLVEPGAGADRRPRRNEVRDFYANHFVSQIPRDMEVFPGRWRSGRITPCEGLICRTDRPTANRIK